MTASIAGKTAIVTGAAHGVGCAIARHFVDEGANVVFADRDEKALEREAGQLVTDGGTVRLFIGDLQEKLTITNLLSATIDAFDGIDILVNAACQFAMTDPLDPDDFSASRLIEHNTLAAMRLSQATARRMIKMADGREEGPVGAIVNLSSIRGQRSHPDMMGMSMASAATDQMTRGLAVALAPQRIRVNGVAFGSVMSASLKAAINADEKARSEILRATPLGRIASAGEVAQAVHFLASDAAGFITGQILNVDGGRTLIDAVAIGHQ